MARLKLKKALIIADVQNDFCPKGALAVPDGDKIVPAVNRYIRHFSDRDLPVFITRDWHPERTVHFKKYGGPWPAHCVQGTKGAQFHPKLDIPEQAVIMSKGMDPSKDSYSAFESFDAHGTPLANLLDMWGIRELYVGGLATEYCVKQTVIDALTAGFGVGVLVDAIRGVELKKGDSQAALREMKEAGAREFTIAKFGERT